MINLVYDEFTEKGPLPNGLAERFINTFDQDYCDTTQFDEFNVLTRFTPLERTRTGYFPLLLEESSFKFNVVSIENVKANEINWLVIEPSYIDTSLGEDNCFLCLSDKAKKSIQDGTVILVIYYPYEAFPLWRTRWIHRIEAALLMLNFDSKNVVLILGDYNLKANYPKYLEEFNPIGDFRFQKYIGYADHFEFEFQDYLKGIENPDNEIVPDNDETKNHKRVKHFLCLNGGGRQLRLVFLGELFRNDLDQFGFISFLNKYNISPRYEELFAPDKEKIKWHKNWWIYLKPMLLDTEEKPDQWHNRGMTAQNYLDTYVNFVTETAPTEPSFFITEKTFKPIVNLQPFLMVGSPGTLEYIRNEGYVTFPEMFDESYDRIESIADRVDAVINEAKKICNLNLDELHLKYVNIYEKLVHNRETFMSKRHRYKIDNILKEMLE